MFPSPWGALFELALGVLFLAAAARSWTQARERPDHHGRVGTLVDLIVGTAALVDAVAS